MVVLAGELPGAEAAKELKEWLEDKVENPPDPDLEIKSIYQQHGNDPFWGEYTIESPIIVELTGSRIRIVNDRRHHTCVARVLSHDANRGTAILRSTSLPAAN